MFQNTLSTFFFAAALQGFLLAGALGLHKRNIQANHILAVWVALLSVDLLGQIYYEEALYLKFPQFIGITNFLPLSYGGFLFLYVRSLTQAKPIGTKDIVHFVGFFLGLAVNLPNLLEGNSQKLLLVENIIADQAPWCMRVIDWFMPIYATGYALYSSILFRRYRQSADSSMPRLKWLQTLLTINMVIWMVVWLANFSPSLLFMPDNQVIYLLVSLFIYVLGYVSLRQPDIFSAIKERGPKYGDNRLPDDLRKQILAVLEQHMREQMPWRSNNVTLAQLAENTGLASHHISQVLNDHHGQSFNDYLNQYRVNAICQLLSESHSQNLLDMALDCGFSSKSSFNAAFKKYTGKTPSEYRKHVQD